MSMLLTMLDALDDLPQARELRERTHELLGDTVVDVGCGAGRAVGELGARGVTAIGVDLDFTGPMILPMLGTMADGDWLDEQAGRARDDRLFVAVPMFLVAGTRVD